MISVYLLLDSKTKGFCKYFNNRKSFVVIYTYLCLVR